MAYLLDKKIPNTSLEAFEKYDPETFPAIIHNFFHILLTLPATSATANEIFLLLTN